jgi:hypothetical protein
LEISINQASAAEILMAHKNQEFDVELKSFSQVAASSGIMEW